jgi:uncharacterized membrane protein
VEVGKFTNQEKTLIIRAIAQAESETSGEIRVHASYAKTEADIAAAAKFQFDRLNMANTTSRNAILLYINPILKKFALYGDEGVHQKVGQKFWDELAREVTGAIREKNRTHGVIHAIAQMGHALRTHFPEQVSKMNELSNHPTESD